MKPIERISLYLHFKSISFHAFERSIELSNGYLAKQLKHQGSVGSDILIKIHEHYIDLNMLWVLTGEGEMILPNLNEDNTRVDEFTQLYVNENIKMKNLEEEVEKMNTVVKDKDKIISLYEFMLHQQTAQASANAGQPN